MSLTICIISNERGGPRDVIERLEAWGHRVSVLPSADLKANPSPDLFVVDLPVDGGTLLDTVTRLQKGRDTRHIPIIVVSSHPEFEYEVTNVFDFMTKPVDVEHLQENCTMISRGARRPARDAVELFADADYRLFYDFLVSRSGLRFDPHNVKFLTRGIRSRMQVLQIHSFRDYFDYLTRYHESRQELQKLVQLLTVGETYFFRYRAQFEALGRIARKSFSRDGEGRLRIWSAGCSTGEEPYSIAMSIMDAVPQWRSGDITITATDINKRSLRLAAEGVYRPWAMRAVDQHHLRRYFDSTGDCYRIHEEVKRLVQFRHLNLKTSRIPSPEKGLADLDAIFCRNVLIYFDAESMHRVVERLAEALRPGGHLFLGHSEVLSPVPPPLERVAAAGVFHYRKKKKVTVAVPRSSGGMEQSPREDDSTFGDARSTAPVEKASDQDPEALYREALDLLDRDEIAEASRILGHIISKKPDHVGALVTQGFILANRGEVENSQSLCTKALSLNDLLPDAYFLKAVLFETVDDAAQAIAEYRKAILLDMNFVMAHYRLGRLFLRLGRTRDGLRELRTCIRTLQRQQVGPQVPFGGGTTREEFLEQVRGELALAGE